MKTAYFVGFQNIVGFAICDHFNIVVFVLLCFTWLGLILQFYFARNNSKVKPCLMF